MVMISILANKLSYKVKNIPVTHLPRPGGTESISGLLKWKKVAKRCIREIRLLQIAIKKNK